MEGRPAQPRGSSLMRSLRRAAPAALLWLAACGKDEAEPVREAGASEARALEEAAEMLEQQRRATKREEPAGRSPSPSPSPSS